MIRKQVIQMRATVLYTDKNENISFFWQNTLVMSTVMTFFCHNNVAFESAEKKINYSGVPYAMIEASDTNAGHGTVSGLK